MLGPRLQEVLDAIEHGLVERTQAVRLALLAALAGEHTLMIGPPGTAKSELARRLHLAFRDARYFERLLTRFTVPEELFGPLSIQALEQDRYERHTAGFLPDASIAFIDEVFRANSAILNALLTLLNEREFDNGAGRQRCPLVSVVGATNAVPEDEVAEAFFDRFLVCLPISPVSPAGFAQLLRADRPRRWTPPGIECQLSEADLAALSDAAAQVRLLPEVATVLGELRHHLAAQGIYVSDRRWVKVIWLMSIAAASEGRASACLWDLLVLPWCTAPDVERQAAVRDWLCTRLGVRQAFSPPRLTRVVEAFEAQLETERSADDLDYDESGRLRFSTQGLAAEVGDAKGASHALRITHTRRRRYGAAHIHARTRQLEELLARIDAYAKDLARHAQDLAQYRAQALWLDADFGEAVTANLAATAQTLCALRERVVTARAGFVALPRLAQDTGEVPAPVEHELAGVE
ncbi:MAG: AAA family ATPase [Burkholderiales bacterium]